MVNRNPKPDLDYKRCVGCGGILSMRRCPTFLTVDTGAIVGPFHAGCAERKLLEARKRPDPNWLKGAAQYGNVRPGREETLPW